MVRPMMSRSQLTVAREAKCISALSAIDQAIRWHPTGRLPIVCGLVHKITVRPEHGNVSKMTARATASGVVEAIHIEGEGPFA